ncbi:hypothetical protein BDW22DRAFT_1419267 [Trametopsis cervina]|nr:hypothetical protein BDW22DRAFT_1419267 [Trametopsis cervina]
MTVVLGPPTAQLPSIRTIKSSPVPDLLQAIHYLGLVYNPEIRGSHILDRRICPLNTYTRPGSPRSPRRRLATLKSRTDIDLSAVRADPFERAYAVRWLTALVSQATLLEDPSAEMDLAAQDAASLLAICAGAASAGNRQRVFVFSNASYIEYSDIKVRINDLSLDNQDYSSMGAQTWGGACLLADMIVQTPLDFGLTAHTGKQPRILELGAGTGLVGLTAAKLIESWGSTAQVVLTDFQPSVLRNLANNVAENFIALTTGDITISSHYLDWSNPPNPLVPPFEQQFDVIYGADIIYEIDHARWIKTCVEKFLRKPSLDSLISLPPSSPDANPVIYPRFHLVIPFRQTHTVESDTVETVFPFAPSVRAGWDSPPNDASNVAARTLAITAKELILCEDSVWSDARREIEYIHYIISWV